MSDASPVGDGVFGPPSPADDETAERKPKTTRRPRLSRVREAIADAPAAGDAEPKPKPATTERKPRVSADRPAPRPSTGKREPADWLFAMVYGGIGSALARSPEPTVVPAGRAMTFNTGVAARAFDGLFAGTVIDRVVLQPLSTRKDKVEAAGNAAGLPLLIYALTVRPELWTVLAPMAREMFYANVAAMAPLIAEQKKRAKEMAKVMEDLVREGAIPANEDGTAPDPEALFEAIFAPVEPARDPDPTAT